MLSKQEIVQRIQDLLNAYKDEQSEIMSQKPYRMSSFCEGQFDGAIDVFIQVIADLEVLLKESE